MDREEVQRYLEQYNRIRSTSLVLGELVGAGGMGEVYDLLGTNPPQVMKIMKTNRFDPVLNEEWLVQSSQKKLYEYFVREISSMWELRGNPYSMPLLDYLVLHDPENDPLLPAVHRTWNACFILIMPRLTPLRTYLKSHGSTEDLLIRLAKDICRCLIHMEKKQILHRDVKPMNIFVDDRGDSVRFVLGDFGICRREEIPAPNNMTMLHPTGFTAQELLDNTREEGWFNADVYSLGAVLYAQVSNKLPSDYYYKGIFELTFPETVSREFARIIGNACKYRFRERYRGAAQMLEELDALLPNPDSRNCRVQAMRRSAEALQAGDLALAADYASFGADLGDPVCQRVAVYCSYNLLRKERRSLSAHADHERWEVCNRKMENLIAELEELIFSEDDAGACCLRGLIYMEEGQTDMFYRYIRRAANGGFAMAQYYCGRALWEGWGRIPDRKAGWGDLLRAAQAGYLPAVVFMREELYPLDTEFNLPSVLEKQILAPEPTDGEIRSNILRFLLS